jgi:Na+/phosphate symporter
MEIRLVIFLALISVTLFTNTLLIWFAYKAFAGLASRVTKAANEFQKTGLTKAWIGTMETAAQETVRITEIAKQKMAEYEPALQQAQKGYAETLAKLDSRLDEAGDAVSDGARKMRDTVAKPAFKFMSFMAQMTRKIQDLASEEEEM